MKALTFSDTSWHYKLATRAGFDEYERQDICTYMRYVFGGGFGYTVITAFLVGLTYITLHMLFGIVFSIAYWNFVFDEAGMVALILYGSALITTFIVNFIRIKNYVIWKIIPDNKDTNEPRPDGFIKNAYKSWKGKFCVRVVFTGESVKESYEGY